jgi:hypothetical protein
MWDVARFAPVVVARPRTVPSGNENFVGFNNSVEFCSYLRAVLNNDQVVPDWE